MKRHKKIKQFATEAAMCAQFLAHVPEGWTPYAETAGWDILLSRNSDGFQIGIQAKLKLNADVINQAIEEGYSYTIESPGPDCRAIMVPSNESNTFAKIAAYIGLTIIRVRTEGTDGNYGHFRKFTPDLPDEKDRYWNREWHECCPVKRHRLPDFVPDVEAGAPAPVQLTRWKIGAIKIAVTLEQRGYLTRFDFKHAGIDHRRWIAAFNGWLKIETPGRYIRGDKFPDFKAQHPRVYAEIAAKAEEWMVPEIAVQPVVGKLL